MVVVSTAHGMVWDEIASKRIDRYARKPCSFHDADIFT